MALLPKAPTEKPLNLKAVTHGKLTWLDIEKPTTREIEYLARNYPFHPLDLEDFLQPLRLPKIDEYEDYLFLALQFPVFDKVKRVSRASEVDFFVGHDYVITGHIGELKPLAKFFLECQTDEKVRQQCLGKTSGYLFYCIVDRLVDYCLPMVNKIVESIEDIEDKVFSRPTSDTVREMLSVRRDLISFRRILRPQIAILDSLETKERPYLGKDLDVYFGDIGDHLDKIWDVMEEYKEVVDVLTDSSNWLTSHRIQEVMRVLGIASAIVLPLIVISGIWGQNIGLPLQDHPYAFPILLAVNGAVVAAMLGFFRWMHWI